MKEDNKQLQTAQPQQVGNIFANQQMQNVNEGAVTIEMSRAVAEAQGKLMIAQRFPRNEMKSFQSIINACSRFGLANQAIFSYPKGGKNVSGPSIRLAEEMARSWGNIEFGIRELSQKDGVSEMEAYAWDLERNVQSSQKFTVKHELYTNNGIKKLTDPRDVYELTANMGGRRLRARIMAILPPDMIDAAIEQCRLTIAGQSSEPLEDRVRKMLKEFTAFGVQVSHIEKYIGHKVDDIIIDEFIDLRGIYISIRDGQFKVEDWFSDKAIADGDKKALNKLNRKDNQANKKDGAEKGEQGQEEVKPEENGAIL